VSAAFSRGPDAFALDPVVVAARALTRAAEDLAPVTARIHADAARVHTRLGRVVAEGRMDRAVMVVDDSPTALAGLVSILSALGVPLHAVTDDRTVASALLSLGASEVHVVPDYGAVPGLWRRHRCAVVVIDEHLGDHSGAALVARMPRGPRAVFVSSHDGARESLDDAARVTQAEALLRTDRGEWQAVLLAGVSRLLTDACG
jgi:CheY-like chemotaxis protein